MIKFVFRISETSGLLNLAEAVEFLVRVDAQEHGAAVGEDAVLVKPFLCNRRRKEKEKMEKEFRVQGPCSRCNPCNNIPGAHARPPGA